MNHIPHAPNHLAKLRFIFKNKFVQKHPTNASSESGWRGVTQDKSPPHKYRANIKHAGTRYNLGAYQELNDAIKAVRDFEEEAFIQQQIASLNIAQYVNKVINND